MDYLKKLAELKVQEDALSKERQANEDKAFNANMIGALGDVFANRQTAGNFWLGKMNPRQNISGITNKFADRAENRTKNREDEIARAKDLLQRSEMAKQNREADFSNQLKLQKLRDAQSYKNVQLNAGIDAKKEQAKDLKKQEELFVPGLGYAQTREDAKKLKDAVEMKGKFDSQIGEMIALREKYGAEMWNSEAVERGKQLSKDLLLTYKNLAKLGVLSKSDEAIVNQIIPADPLEWKAASLKGQDPIMAQLKAFQQDSDEDYSTTLKTRLKDGYDVASKLGLPSNSTSPLKEAAAKPKAPPIDAVEDGYKFKGGNPQDPKNWEKVK